MTQIVTLGAFALALPDQMPAASPGGNAIMNVKTTARNGRPIMASIGPVGGGGGGAPFCDGSDGAGGATGFLRNTPIEISEAEVPIRFLRYGLEPDTGAPGRYRGGLSAIMEFEISSPETVVTARNRNRSIMPGWGVNAAGPAPSRNSTEPWPRQRSVARQYRCRVLRARRYHPGHRARRRRLRQCLHTAPAAVLADIRSGAVTPATAERDYGVVIRDGEIDEAATSALREGRSAEAARSSPTERNATLSKPSGRRNATTCSRPSWQKRRSAGASFSNTAYSKPSTIWPMTVAASGNR